MTEFIHLIGSEDVRAAASSIHQSSSSMQSAANQMTEALDKHMLFMNDWMYQLQEVLLKLQKLKEK